MFNVKTVLVATVLGVSLLLRVTPIFAASDSEDADEVLEDVVVTGSIPRGAVRTPVPAETRVERAVIRASGANDLDDVLSTFAPQSRSLHQDSEPILLLNGRRIADRNEIEAIPPEAIRRLEIFPEEVALQYGYPPDRRVVNIILRRKYSAAELQANSDQALGHGRSTYRAKANLLQLAGDARLNLDTGYRLQEALRDDDAGSGADIRTRLPRAERVTMNGTFARDLTPLQLSSNANGQWRQQDWRLGRGLGGSGLERRAEELTGEASLALHGKWSGWTWSTTGQVELARNRIATQEGGALANEEGLSARGTRREGSFELTSSGPVADGPGGGINGSMSTGFALRRQEQHDLSTSVEDPATEQKSAHIAGSIDVPLMEARRLAVFGDGRLATSNSDDLFGRYGLGLRSSVLDGVDLSIAYSRERSLPEFDDMADMRISTPNVRVYDFASSDARYVLRREGGNPDLDLQDARTLSMRAQLKPFSERDVSLSIEYLDLHLRAAASGTLGPTPQIEAALPERFTRDGNALVAFDSTPFNVARQHRRQVRSGINLTRKLVQEEAAPDEPIEPIRSRDSQLQLALYHTWTLEDEARLRLDAASIDLLHGAAIGNRGGSSRHLIEGQLGLVTRRFGLRLAARYRSPTHVEDATAPADSIARLTFKQGVTVDARMYVNLKLMGEALHLRWLKGKLNLSIDNLLGARTRIRDGNGDSVDYYRGSQDDTGRTIKLSARKVFR